MRNRLSIAAGVIFLAAIGLVVSLSYFGAVTANAQGPNDSNSTVVKSVDIWIVVKDPCWNIDGLCCIPTGSLQPGYNHWPNTGETGQWKHNSGVLIHVYEETDEAYHGLVEDNIKFPTIVWKSAAEDINAPKIDWNLGAKNIILEAIQKTEMRDSPSNNSWRSAIGMDILDLARRGDRFLQIFRSIENPHWIYAMRIIGGSHGNYASPTRAGWVWEEDFTQIFP